MKHHLPWVWILVSLSVVLVGFGLMFAGFETWWLLPTLALLNLALTLGTYFKARRLEGDSDTEV